ncbi:MAG: nuclear transport factor 2 family protein [Wenzhouxiangella sp.]
MNQSSKLLLAVLWTTSALISQAMAAGDDSASVALVKSGYAAAAVGDMATIRSLLAPELVWHEAQTLPYGGAHHGPEAVMQQIFGAIGRDWSEYAAEPTRFVDGGDHVVVLGEYRGVHQRSGGRLQAPFAHVWRIENGRLVEFFQFTDTALWLRAIAGEQSP